MSYWQEWRGKVFIKKLLKDNLNFKLEENPKLKNKYNSPRDKFITLGDNFVNRE